MKNIIYSTIKATDKHKKRPGCPGLELHHPTHKSFKLTVQDML